MSNTTIWELDNPNHYLVVNQSDGPPLYLDQGDSIVVHEKTTGRKYWVYTEPLPPRPELRPVVSWRWRLRRAWAMLRHGSWRLPQTQEFLDGWPD